MVVITLGSSLRLDRCLVLLAQFLFRIGGEGTPILGGTSHLTVGRGAALQRGAGGAVGAAHRWSWKLQARARRGQGCLRREGEESCFRNLPRHPLGCQPPSPTQQGLASLPSLCLGQVPQFLAFTPHFGHAQGSRQKGPGGAFSGPQEESPHLLPSRREGQALHLHLGSVKAQPLLPLSPTNQSSPPNPSFSCCFFGVTAA